ncbi:DUF6779 domain-containing protein [Gordonia sp. 'Campus']|uniref:DUF6779 domain-containing protein n=1 Tax=Gordonia sp. 'Campus' TaxID=2915824 RepID=UPI001EE3F626|nr:DUF6779 domain-containing protein [Gordonia sp. 'Campus']
MTTSNGRSADSRRSSRSPAQWLLGLLIVLALAASVLMVFTDRLSITGSLAVIAALWAAVIGAILVTKFRRQAESAEAKSRDLRLVYELQLEREIAARRQYELDVETTIRKEVTAESNEELSELKAQVLALRSSLEMLLGEPLPDQRAALSSEKMRELASGLDDDSRTRRRHGGSSFGGDFGGVASYGSAYADDGVLAARDFAATAPTADDGRHTGQADPNEMTEVIPVITDDPISGRIATEVPADEMHEQTSASSADSRGTFPTFGGDDRSVGTVAGGEEVSDAEVVEPAQSGSASPATETRTESAESSSLPFSGGFYLGNDANATPSHPSEGEVASVPADQPLYTDDTPTDEWSTGGPSEGSPGGVGSAHDSDGVGSAQDSGGVGSPAGADDTEADQHDAGTTSGENAAADDAVEPPPFLGAAGRHEGNGGRAVDSYGGGRRRRAPEDDAESAHSAGLPVSELLNQLRQQTESTGGGRRRRNG